MITNAIQPSAPLVHNNIKELKKNDEKQKHDTTRSRRSTMTTTEKAIAMAFPEMINAGNSSSSGSSSDSSDNSSDCYSFESLFNGSTYSIDEYFNSIGYNGVSTIHSSNIIGNNNECLSTVSALSGGDGDTFYDCNFVNDNINLSKTSDDVESVYTSSSSFSSTLNGLNIINDALSSSSSSTTTKVFQRNDNASATACTNLEALSSILDPKKSEIKPSSSFSIKVLLALEKFFVALLLLAILTGCMITVLTIVRHLDSNSNKNHSTVVAVPGIMTTSDRKSVV